MQLLSQEKNQNSPDRRGVAHALIKHTVHVSTITLLRGFALHTAHYWEGLCGIIWRLWARALLQGLRWSAWTWKDTQERALGHAHPHSLAFDSCEGSWEPLLWEIIPRNQIFGRRIMTLGRTSWHNNNLDDYYNEKKDSASLTFKSKLCKVHPLTFSYFCATLKAL